MLQDLKELGFTPNEIRIYESLLKIGETPVGGIINDLKIHRQIVYNALDTLEKRSMVTKTMKNRVYHFKITDPEIIVENIQKQELIAKRL
ncbi:MAG: helix-turn-helix domain-containing protein, partial [Patescibacteria group bacterium]|nr:helix-turn-helix domain-containing protein [Patescibacteria group bacterium]